MSEYEVTVDGGVRIDGKFWSDIDSNHVDHVKYYREGLAKAEAVLEFFSKREAEKLRGVYNDAWNDERVRNGGTRGFTYGDTFLPEFDAALKAVAEYARDNT